MIYKVIDHPEWDHGRFRITVSDTEIRAKCNAEVTNGKYISELAHIALMKKSDLGITVTVRSWDENTQETGPVRFYTLVAGKKTTLFSVKREV